MQFSDPKWQPVLGEVGMPDFAAIWDFELQPVDVPNKGRGGWSEVCYFRLPQARHGVQALYIKRQQDFGFFDWRKPFRGLPTFEREHRNLVWCLGLGLPVVEPIGFDVRDIDGHRQAILITRSLDDYFALDDMDRINSLGIVQRRAIIGQVADIIKQMHDRDVQHGCLYPKHIFAKVDNDDQVAIRLIDLEKAGKLSFWNRGIIRDLDSLNRRSYGFTRSDRLVFLRQYCKGNHAEMRSLIDRLSD